MNGNFQLSFQVCQAGKRKSQNKKQSKMTVRKHFAELTMAAEKAEGQEIQCPEV